MILGRIAGERKWRVLFGLQNPGIVVVADRFFQVINLCQSENPFQGAPEEQRNGRLQS